MKRGHPYVIGVIAIIVFWGSCRVYATVEEDWERVKTENTIVAYEEFLQKYPQETVTQEAYKRLEELYFQRIKQTKIYVKWIEEQHQQAHSAELTDNDLIQALSRSTGEFAQQLIDETLSMACQGQPSDYGAVLAVSENRYARVKPRIIVLPDSIKATTPSDFYYAICITQSTEDIDKCEYGTGSPGGLPIGYIVPRQLIRNIELRESRTGKQIDSIEIRGERPACPSSASFTFRGEIQYIEGAEPSSAESLNWVYKTVGVEKQAVQEKFVSVVTPIPLYSEPYSQGSILVNMEAGTTLVVIGEEGVWYQVKTPNNITGWVAKGWVKE